MRRILVVVGILALVRGTPLQRALEEENDNELNFCTTEECIGASYRCQFHQHFTSSFFI